MASWQGFINAMQSPGKFAGFFETEAATINPLIADQACFTWSAHSVASGALSDAQAATKGSKLLEQYASKAVTCGASAPVLAGGGGGPATPTLLSTAAILCSKRLRTFWSSCVPDMMAALCVRVRFFETGLAVACGLARSRLRATVRLLACLVEERCRDL